MIRFATILRIKAWGKQLQCKAKKSMFLVMIEFGRNGAGEVDTHSKFIMETLMMTACMWDVNENNLAGASGFSVG